MAFQSPKTGLCFSHLPGIVGIFVYIIMFQSPKTGLCYFHYGPKRSEETFLDMFQSPKTGQCFSHFYYLWSGGSGNRCFNPLKRVYAFLTFTSKKCLRHYWRFQSPKTGLCFSHQSIHEMPHEWQCGCFNPLKRVYAFLTGKVVNGMQVTQYVSIP